MRIISDNIKKWMDWDVLASEQPRLREDAPEDVKKEFEEWVRKCEKDDIDGVYG